MIKRPDILATAARLLSVKKARGLSEPVPPVSEPEEGPPVGGVACVNCGYSQEGQQVDRCPECGLLLASSLRDSTPWISDTTRAIGWWETARRIWLWDRHIRIRTSYLPITEQSGSFAKWSVGSAAVLLGLALAVFNSNASAPHLLAVAHLLVQWVIGTGLAGLLLAGGVWGLTISIRGTWRRGLRFIPSSIHYATAWWPLVSLLALLAACSWRVLDTDESRILTAMLPLVAAATWGLWLWGSITEGQHVQQVGARLTVIASCLYAAGAGLIFLVPGSSRMLMVTLLDRTGSSLVKLNVFGTYSAIPAQVGPQTCALIIDMIPDSGDEDLVEDRITKMGAESRVSMRGKECTLEQIEKAFRTARDELRPEDRFILYINGHGMSDGSGVIAIAEGFLTSQKLSELVAKMPTKRCLVVIASCYGGKFISALKDSATCNAVVVTTTDNRNVAYRSGFRRFWTAMGETQSDRNRDGKVTVDEAYNRALPEMLKDGEGIRTWALATGPMDPKSRELLEQQGNATPQVEVIGEASKEDFSVPVLVKKLDCP